jgi:hypothetical protein
MRRTFVITPTEAEFPLVFSAFAIAALSKYAALHGAIEQDAVPMNETLPLFLAKMRAIVSICETLFA